MSLGCLPISFHRDAVPIAFFGDAAPTGLAQGHSARRVPFGTVHDPIARAQERHATSLWSTTTLNVLTPFPMLMLMFSCERMTHELMAAVCIQTPTAVRSSFIDSTSFRRQTTCSASYRTKKDVFSCCQNAHVSLCVFSSGANALILFQD